MTRPSDNIGLLDPHSDSKMGTAFRSLPTGNKHKGGYFFGFLKKGRQPRGPPFISSPYQHAFLVFSQTKGEQVGLIQTCNCLFSQTMKRKQVGVFKLEKAN